MIELKHIEKRFGDNVVLNDVSISIPEGTVTALVGPSGGGKSTLLRCVNLLEVPTRGSVRIGEEAGLPVQISHHKAAGRENWGRTKESLALIDDKRAGGLDVTIDAYPYVASSTALS